MSGYGSFEIFVFLFVWNGLVLQQQKDDIAVGLLLNFPYFSTVPLWEGWPKWVFTFIPKKAVMATNQLSDRQTSEVTHPKHSIKGCLLAKSEFSLCYLTPRDSWGSRTDQVSRVAQNWFKSGHGVFFKAISWWHKVLCKQTELYHFTNKFTISLMSPCFCLGQQEEQSWPSRHGSPIVLTSLLYERGVVGTAESLPVLCSFATSFLLKNILQRRIPLNLQSQKLLTFPETLSHLLAST